MKIQEKPIKSQKCSDFRPNLVINLNQNSISLKNKILKDPEDFI